MLTKLLPTLIPLVVTVLVALSGTASDWVSHHALAFTALMAAKQVLNHWIPSPAQ